MIFWSEPPWRDYILIGHPCTVAEHPFLGVFPLFPFQKSGQKSVWFGSVQLLNYVQLCDPMDCSTPGLPVHHQLPESTQTHVHWVSDAIQPSHPLSSPSPPALNLSQHQGLFQWVSSSHQVDKIERWRIDAFELWCWRRLLRVPFTARRSSQSILKEISPEYSLKRLMLKLNSNILATWCKELTHWERSWCWERVKAGGEGDDRGWDGCMASPTQWTWVWVSSGSWWWTGTPGLLQSMGLQRVGCYWETELNWLCPYDNCKYLYLIFFDSFSTPTQYYRFD